MTTPARARLYLAQREAKMEGKGWSVYNPLQKPANELPVIYGFNNGGSHGWYEAVLMAEDGTCLGAHACSEEGYMLHDLGILEGTRPDRHVEFQKHYPDGYRMAFVNHIAVKTHPGLQTALQLNHNQKDPHGPERPQ